MQVALRAGGDGVELEEELPHARPQLVALWSLGQRFEQDGLW